MSNSVISLLDFVDPVAEITGDIDFEYVSTIFQSGVNQAVVVNQQRSPLGVIYARSLLAQYLRDQSFNLNSITIKTLIKPIVTLPSTMSLVNYYTQFVAQQHLDYDCFVVVDAQNRLLGILDTAKILQAIAIHNLPEQNLLTLLEKFPIPVMLQTNQGKILAQNYQWRQQIGDFIPIPATINSLTYDHPQYLTLDDYIASDNFHNLTTELVNRSLFIPEQDSFQHPNHRWEFCKVPLNQLDLTPSDTEIEKLVWLVLANDLKQDQNFYTKLTSQSIAFKEVTHIKDDLLLGITHNLKSPLTSIIALSSLLREQKLGQLNPRQSRYVELIHQSGRKMINIVNELLDFSRLENGSIKINLESIEIQSICEQIYQEITEKLTEKNLEYILKIKTNLKTIKADSLRLRQMLSHLLDNAIKYTLEEGKIGLTVDVWQNWLAFTVWDTGIGISEDDQKLLLQKFHPPNHHNSQIINKTGLGLLLTQGLAQMHGGDISFISKEEMGSSFTILIPLQTDIKKINTITNSLVLLVETVPGYIQELHDFLTNQDYQVIVARSAPETIEKAYNLQPDLILLNTSIPSITDSDVLTKLKSDGKTKQIPVFLTIQPWEKIKHKAKQAQEILTLPVDKKLLMTKLNKLFSEKITPPKSITILYLHPDTQLEWLLHTHASSLIKRILEADSLEQGELLATFWHVDAIVFNGSMLGDRQTELTNLSHKEILAKLPLITLDKETTRIANQIPGLQVFPCLISPEQKNTDYFLEVIYIAIGMDILPDSGQINF